MKNKKMYGIVNPRSLDYFLSFVSALISLSALWTAIWVSTTGSFSSFEAVLDILSRAITCSFGGDVLITIIGMWLYIGIFSCVSLLVLLLVGRNHRAIVGVVSMLMSVFAIALQLSFFAVYILAFSGIYAAVLGFLMLLELVILWLTFKQVFCTSLVLRRGYEEYLSDFPTQDEEEVELEEEEAEEEVEKEAEKPKKKPKKEPKKEPKQQEKSVEKKEKKKEPQEEAKEELEDEPEEETELSDAFSSKRLTFDERLRRVHKETRAKFKEIKEYFESLGFKPARTKSAETFVYKNVKYAQITTMGKNGLKIYYKLSAKDYEGTPIPVEDMSSVRKYESIPLLFKVKSDLSVKRAKKLMDDVKQSIQP